MEFVLKTCVWDRDGDVLVVVCDPGEQIELIDPDGKVETLLDILRTGPYTPAAVRTALAERGIEAGAEEIDDVLTALDGLRLIENAHERSLEDPAVEERHFSNLAFFGLFSSMRSGRARMQNRLRNAHVLQLGTGGLGSNVVQSMAGLGIGRLTLLDDDMVEPRNFARQFLYRADQIGEPKVFRAADWVRAYDPSIDVRAVHKRVIGPQDVADLLKRVDVVVAGVDTPPEVDLWVNEACVRAGVPLVRGGVVGAGPVYYSVDPGRSACLACRDAQRRRELTADGLDGVVARLVARLPNVNTGIGPILALVGSLVAFEALCYLTRFQEPYAAGATVTLDRGDGFRPTRRPWPRDPVCELCDEAFRRTGATTVLAPADPVG
ncbi:HesA/MoeB/ThiF family protein [Actinoallomurus sp. CA-150999]|uniref:HesA/MoeB/ThiF family protein n=1 Tax=Actinoallomurus sp. CA-150999 TaxID=3239887 RepID=UPI003D8BD906